MRLQNIEIKGFKSFANQTILNFNEQVTGVVGPNGSGKSNIVDAIRWVLGEQKGKELRLDQMSDVIFNGTKSRKAGGVAQVSLTFDNDKGILPTEYNQLTVSRLLYRNGDSEYRLNSVSCRLKDIKSLLMDTGIGSNSYAIIALGMVDDILQDKEQARRKMFEQAAGISKFKIRKRETVNKLKLTNADLDRVEDLLHEISENLKALEKQAKKAEKYLKLKEDYQYKSIVCAKLELEKLKESYETLKTKIREEQDLYRSLDTKIIEDEAKLAKEKKDHLLKEQQLSEFQKEQNRQLETIRSLENTKSLAIQKTQFLEERIQYLDNNIIQDQTKLDDHKSSVNLGQNAIENLQSKYQSLMEDINSSKQKYDLKKSEFENLKTKSDQKTAELEKLNTRLIDNEKNQALIKLNIENIESGIQSRRSELREYDEQIIGAQKQSETAGVEISRLQKIVETLEQQRQQAEESLQSISKSIEDKKKHLDIILRKQDAIRNERELIHSMIESFEGYPDSLKFLKTEWDHNLELLSDVISVKDDFKLCIEQYLEPFLNHYVVRSEKEAYKAIEVLNEAQKGKANFFVLDRIEEKASNNSPYAEDPRIISAMEVVSCDTKYHKLLESLFSHCYILDSGEVDSASLKYEEGTTILAKTGVFVDRGTEIYGGSIGLFEGSKLGRKSKLKSLDDSLEQISRDIVSFEESLQELELQKSKIEFKSIAQQINESRQALNDHIRNNEYTLEKIKAGEQRKSSAKEQIEREESRIKDLQEQNLALIQSYKEMDANRSKMLSEEGSDQYLSAFSEELSKLYEAYNKLQLKEIQDKGIIQSKKKDLAFEQNRIQELERRIQNYKQDKSRQDNELKDYLTKSKNAEAELLELYGQKTEKSESFSKIEAEFHKEREAITTLEDSIKKLVRSQNQSQLLINNLKDQFTDYKLKMNSVSERINIEFKIDLHQYSFEEEPPEYNEELKMKVERLRSRLYNYGEVNPMAVEAYAEMQKRHESITSQRDDIIEAKESLMDTIDEIQKNATERYLSAFNEVRNNFREVFRSLFTEDDDCDLVLLDPEHPVESQIDIIAKPKGKRPKSLSQLSGGEKTLTAIALLFGLYLLKPAPFCVFDEVDAPLDDANIQKFNKIIQKFSKDSQFIIVTHNKSTMADVDVLYGVYMQEQGVSGVAPVDFRNYDHEAVLQGAV